MRYRYEHNDVDTDIGRETREEQHGQVIKDHGEWKLVEYYNLFGEFEELEGIIDSYDDVRNYEFQAQNE